MRTALFGVLLLFLTFYFQYLFQSYADRNFSDASNRSVAANFLVYRNTAFAYAVENNSTGNIPFTVLTPSLPGGYLQAANWQAQVIGNVLYVYGPATDQVILAACELARGSPMVGKAENGKIMPQRYNPVSVPAAVPAGSLVSVLGLGREP
jgi:hypothetical protein